MSSTVLIERINRILAGLAGCRFEFESAQDLAQGRWNPDDLLLLGFDLESATRRVAFIRGTDSDRFGFPIIVSGKFAGLAVVQGLSPESESAAPSRLTLLSELMTEVLQHGLSKMDRNESLRLIEERLNLMRTTKESDEKSNVVQLRRLKPVEALPNEDEIEEELITEDGVRIDKPTFSPVVTSIPLLIETKSSTPLQKIIVEIHQLSERWALLSLNDLASDVLNSRQSLMALGGITLFIPDLSALSIEQQIKLAEYISTERSDEMPHVVAALAIDKSQETVLPHLLELFRSSRLKWADKESSEISTAFIKRALQRVIEGREAEVATSEHQVGNRLIPFNIQYFNSDNPTVH